MTDIVLQHGGQRALNMQNNQGETPLHLAARAHDTATADLLLRAAQKAGTETAMLALRDARGHTAAEWAALVWSPVLQTICQHSPTHCQPTRPFKENTESLTVDKDYRRGFDDFAPGADDWRVESTREPSLELSANNEQQRCGIDRRTALSPEEFEQQYVNQHRPVLIGAGAFARDFATHRLWGRHNLTMRYGNLDILVGTLPYERKVRTASSLDRAAVLPLEDYIQKMGQLDHANSLGIPRSAESTSSPLYAFDRGKNALRMLHDVGKLKFFNASRFEQVSMQWYLGSSRTGANDHYHGHAFNVLLHGAKRWFLTPTPFASYSNKTAWEWYQNDFPRLKDAHQITECMQFGGEVMYVPSGWGHAVLNTATSIGFSGEFKVHRDLYPQIALGEKQMVKRLARGGKRKSLDDVMQDVQYERLKRQGDGYGLGRHFVHAFSQGML